MKTSAHRVRRRSGPIVLALLIAWATASAGEDPAQRARAQLAPFKKALKRALKQGLAEGPVAAVDACRVKAPAIASEQSRDGIRVGRASHRLRNPANTAPEWVQPVLDRYLASPAARAPATVPLGDGRSGYVEPILLQPLCLTCHGETLAPALAARIEALYPDDQATGFRPGDLRGVFWIELPAAP